MALSPQWLDELRARVTLSGVIMRTTKLQRAGREWKACCPFHDEKTPSFTVNDAKGFYHCFGCGAHGDVIRWMTDQRGMAFMDAVKELAAQANLEVPAADPQAAQRAEKRASLHDVVGAAQEWFVDNLASADGADARAYLERRGFSQRICREFGFGFAPDSKTALARNLSRIEEPMLVEAGLLIDVEDKAPYDRFRGRLMLPIQDARGRVIAFGGRIMEDRANPHGGVAKYLNSPDTPLFDKGRTLYNLHRAAPASRQTDRVVVVEGYMDVIALANAGIGDAVAPLGTALTENQIELLWRLVDKPVLCFDGDAAGQRAAMRAASRALPLLRPGKSLQFVYLPTGLDPDDLLKQRGRGAMEELLANPRSLLEAIWLQEREAAPLHSPEDKAGLKQRMLEHSEAIGHPDIKALYRREWMERFSAFAFPPRQQSARFNGQGKWQPRTPSLAPANAAAMRQVGTGGHDRLLSAVIAGLARHSDQLARHAERLAGLKTADAKMARAVDILLDHAEMLEKEGGDTIRELEDFAAPQDKLRYSFLMEGTDPLAAREDLAEAVALVVERPALEAALKAATERFDSDPEGAFAEQQRLRQRKQHFDERLKQMGRRRMASSDDGVETIGSSGHGAQADANEQTVD